MIATWLYGRTNSGSSSPRNKPPRSRTGPLPATTPGLSRCGRTGYETGEREELTWYIGESLAEAGIDLPAFEARNGIGDAGIAGPWRRW